LLAEVLIGHIQHNSQLYKNQTLASLSSPFIKFHLPPLSPKWYGAAIHICSQKPIQYQRGLSKNES